MPAVLLVTGAGRGIGAATAIAAAARGYAVCVNYNASAEPADQVVAAIRQQGGTAIAVQGDVGSEADVVHLFETVDRELGPLDALVNNAGIIGAPATRVEGVSVAQIEETLRINVLGCFLCAREAVRRMSTKHGGKGGAIVNISSAAARLGSPGEFVHYAASKGAVDTFTTGLALEVAAEGIRVNAVRPGLIETDIHEASGIEGRVAKLAPTVPMQRAGSAEETASAIIWLLSEDAAYVTGTFVDVSGGR